jgi:hypothetical protein
MLAATFAVAQQSSGPSDPLEYFAEMMPVFTHDRCTGCHGRVNPERATGNNHSMGQFTDSRDCIDCHTQTPGWKTRPDLAFINKTTKQLCQMQSSHVEHIRNSARAASMPIAHADAAYLAHLSGDNLIGAAFIGEAAGALSPANPPRLSRREFVDAARDWLKVGAGCGEWKGTITQTEKFEANYGYPADGGKRRVHHAESANSQVTITRDNGVSKGTFTMGGQSTLVQTMDLGGCTSTTTVNGSWGTDTPADSPVSVTIKIADDGSYTIRFVGPHEKTRSSSTDRTQHNCPGPQLPASPSEPPLELDWNPWAFTIRCPSPYAICQLFDPDNRTLSGTFERTILNHEDAADPHSRLTTSLAGISRSDTGGSLPVKVTATWDLTLED